MIDRYPVLLTPILDTTRVSAAAAPIVAVKAVSRRLGGHPALSEVSFNVRRGDILGIIGRSGAGKSTLIRCLTGLERVDSGSITIEQTDITKLSGPSLQKVRQRVGMVFQHFNLLSAKTAADNVGLPLLIAGRSKQERTRRIEELLELVGLTAHARKYPHQLSGGQKQRVGIARALAASPALLLCDEATSALDPETTTSILALLNDINRRLDVTMVLITHEMSVIRSLARQVIVLDQGRLVEEGAVSEIFAMPRSEVTRSLLRGFRPELPAPLVAQVESTPFAGSIPLIRVDLAGASARGALLSQATLALGIEPRLLHGGIEEVQGTPIGTLYLSLPGVTPADLPKVLDFFSAHSQSTEVLGHVSAAA